MFATRSGRVRRNKLSDFTVINRNGKIAMKLDAEAMPGGDAIVGVSLCAPGDDVLLTTAGGRAIRFAVDEVRVFAGRDSTGVRGVRLSYDDHVLSMAVLRGVEATPAERQAYLKHAQAMRSAEGADEPEPGASAVLEDDEEESGAGENVSLSIERLAVLGAAEQHVLTVSSEGYGKRTSAYDFRRTGRGGQGLIAQDLSKRGGRLVAAFPVEDADEILLVTDQGQLIRVPVGQIRIVARNTQGVTIFRTAENEHVVSVERLEGEANGGEANGSDAGAAEGPTDPDDS
jgi:DNA gyrase subunit A